LGTRTVPFIQAQNEACVKEFLFPGNLQMQLHHFLPPRSHQNNQKISSLTQPALIRDWCPTPTWGIKLLSRTGLRLYSSFTFSKLFSHNMNHFSNSNNWLLNGLHDLSYTQRLAVTNIDVILRCAILWHTSVIRIRHSPGKEHTQRIIRHYLCSEHGMSEHLGSSSNPQPLGPVMWTETFLANLRVTFKLYYLS
jgi:hypothetical protein